ncbi:MAG TPA: AsmA-like C-terminal region-containing protein [Lacunisphaera sp.]
MKPVRLLLIVLGMLSALVAVLLGLTLTPSVQRWAVLRAARDVPGLKLELASVSGGFSGVALRGVTAEHRHVVVKLDRLEADFSLFSFLLGEQLVLSRLHAEGLNVDASKLAGSRNEAAAAGAPVAAPGLLARVVLPFDLKLDDVRINGRALLPAAPGQPSLEADYTITGGGFAADKEGLLQVNATLRNPAPGAQVAALHAQAGLRATLTPQRNFNNLTLTTVIDAEGRGLSGQSQLKVGTEFFHSRLGEHYEVVVSTLLQGVAENALILRAQLPVASHRYAGDWEMKVRTAQLEPFMLEGALPAFDVRGGGRFALDAGAESFSMEGDLQGEVSQLERIDPAWRALGMLKVDTTFDLSQLGGLLHLNRFKALVAGPEPVLEARTTAPIRYDLRKGQLLPAEALEGDRLLHVNIQGLPLAWVRPFVTAADISGGMISGEIDLARTPGSTSAASVRGKIQVAELNVVQAGRPLLTKAAVGAQVEATLADGAVDAPVLNLTVTTPAGDRLALNSHLATRAGADAPISLTGRFDASAAQLLSRWLPGAPVKAQGDIDFTLRGQVVEMRPVRLELWQDAGHPLLKFAVKQPFSFNLASQALTPQEAAQPVAQIELGRVPLALLPLTQSGTSLGGFVTQGSFELGVPGEKILLRALAPLKLADVSLAEKKQPLITGLTVEAQPSLEYAASSGARIQTGDVTVRTAAKATLLTLKADANQTPGQGMQATMTFALEVPALASQPLFAGARAVSAGRAVGEVRAAVGSHSQLEARMTVNGLMAAESKQTLPVANLSFRGLVQPNGTVSVQAPLLLDNAGRRSDLDFALEFSPLGTGYSVDGRLTGQQVELEDLLGVLGVFMASAAPDTDDKPLPAPSVTPDTVSAWSRFSGNLGLDIKSVTRGQDWAMTGLTGAVTIEPARLALQKLEASFSETSRLTAKMEMRFTGGAMPYRLTGEYTLNDFDAGKLFKALEPGKPPTVEGLFNVNAKFSGNGETTARALDRLQGEFQMTSHQGIFRGLQRTSNKVSMASKAVDAVAALGSIFGSDKVKQTAEKVAGQAYHVDQLAQSIGEFNYDLLSVRLSRDERLNMSLEEISLVSPEMRLIGHGEVSYVVDRPLLDQPLNASLSLAARGKTEQLFDKLNALDGTKDELGYARTKTPVTIGGTLAKPDPTAFFTKLASAKLADYLDSAE